MNRIWAGILLLFVCSVSLKPQFSNGPGVTPVGALASTAIVTGAGGAAIQTPCATCTLSAGGAMSVLSATATGSAFAGLGTPANGTIQYCSDCTVTSALDNTCAASGGGAIAVRIAGAWKCVI